MNFKNGDRVVLFQDTTANGYSITRIGWTGTVHDVEDMYVNVFFDQDTKNRYLDVHMLDIKLETKLARALK